MEFHIVDKIKKYLAKRDNILSAYLFGSFAKGKGNIYSDIDIAVLFSEDVDKSTFFDSQIAIMNEVAALLNREVDVVVLNNSSTLLKFKIAQIGICIYEKNIIESRRFKAKSIIEYFDFLPIKNFIESNIIARIKEA